MSQKTQNAGGAQDGAAGADRRILCSLAGAAGGLINGIRFVQVADVGLVSESLAAADPEQVQRITSVPEYTFVEVTAKDARRIDEACLAAVSAERAAQGLTTAPSAMALEQSLAEQQRINVIVSEERDRYRSQVAELEAKVANADVKVLQAETEAKAARIAELQGDLERLQGELKKKDDEIVPLMEKLETAEKANASIATENQQHVARIADLEKALKAAEKAKKGGDQPQQ